MSTIESGAAPFGVIGTVIKYREGYFCNRGREDQSLIITSSPLLEHNLYCISVLYTDDIPHAPHSAA